MSPGWAVPVLSVVWSGALAAIVLKLFWVRAPKWLSAAIGLSLGWVGASRLTEARRRAIASVPVRCAIVEGQATRIDGRRCLQERRSASQFQQTATGARRSKILGSGQVSAAPGARRLNRLATMPSSVA